MKLSIKALDGFIRGDFKKHILECYENFEILSEADLQAVAWHALKEFVEKNEPNKDRLKVLNKPYIKKLRAHPDLVIFKHRKPWLLIELKEQLKLSLHSAFRERARLLKAYTRLDPKPKRGYLVYVARYGHQKALRGPKGAGARYFFEIPIVMSEWRTKEHVAAWEKIFQTWGKYVSPTKEHAQ